MCNSNCMTVELEVWLSHVMVANKLQAFTLLDQATICTGFEGKNYTTWYRLLREKEITEKSWIQTQDLPNANQMLLLLSHWTHNRGVGLKSQLDPRFFYGFLSLSPKPISAYKSAYAHRTLLTITLHMSYIIISCNEGNVRILQVELHATVQLTICRPAD